jgi:hypothetical protein
MEPGFDPGPQSDNRGGCEQCGAENVELHEHHVDGECCEPCYNNALEADADYAAETRATRHAENGYGYSGGWTGHESADLGGW